MKELNRQQYRASRPDGGVSLVIAGAGTGKTRTLVEKVKNIIREGNIASNSILILTFSRKAADEIKERVRSVIGEDADHITAGTFHSFCLRFLRAHDKTFLEREGFKFFPEVIDDEAREELIHQLIENSLENFLGLPVDVVKYLMENYERLDKKTKEKLVRVGISDSISELRGLFREYKKKRNCIDFQDMIDYSVRLLAENDDIRLSFIERFRYILVDEFQDTSEDNFRLIKLMLPAVSPALFVVGDDWQSIYGFRNARVEYIVRMRSFFPEVGIFKLRVNYRSRKEIVRFSNRFIRHNRVRTRKAMRSFKGRGGIIAGFRVKGFNDEIISIRAIVDREIENAEEMAILYRNNWQGDYIIENLNDYRAFIDQKKLQLMTIHSSKGLEFHTVIIAGLSDEILPDRSSDLEEERRLLYVALTRAKERLYILYHSSRGGEISRFAGELGFSQDSVSARYAFDL
jgi:superfamily I DNA/RNA helicase